ncbi:MAG: threonine/serine exporter family protein [Bacillota bacterium]|nr:threonine/serine exporter family protein [Bacillota bacterium]
MPYTYYENHGKGLGLALDIGRDILECGGEISRSEDTVRRLCAALCGDKSEVFSITSLLIATVRTSKGEVTQMRRIGVSSNNMDRLERLNSLSRKICSEKVPDEEINSVLTEPVKYPFFIAYIGAVLAAGGFCVFFGGSVSDAIAAALTGIIIQLIGKIPTPHALARTLLCSFAGGISANIAVMVGLGYHPDKIMIGAIMLLIPGLALGNSIRDILSGDLIAGSLRLAQSGLTALSIAAGFGAAIALFGGR